MRAICPWIVAFTFSAGSVTAQIPALEPGVVFGSVADYAGLTRRSDPALNLFGLGLHVRGLHSQRLALGGYVSTEWTWYLNAGGAGSQSAPGRVVERIPRSRGDGRAALVDRHARGGADRSCVAAGRGW